MKTALVSQRVDAFPERGETRDGLDQRLVDFLLTAGCLAVPVPNVLTASRERPQALRQWISRVGPDAVVLSGGNDVGACAVRDATERALLDHARDAALPALGICRGMQMMAVHAGGSLRPVSGHVRSRHPLDGAIGRVVNSFHNQGLASCPDGYAVLARSPDGDIEAMRHRVLPWEGWMWHPEREPEFHPDDLRRLRALLEGESG